jgi:hypothetical protein
MRTQIYLCIDDRILPADSDPDQRISQLAATATATTNDQPAIEDNGKELIVVQRMRAPEGQAYVVVGLHQLRPPPQPNRQAPAAMPSSWPDWRRSAAAAWIVCCD